MPSPISEEGAPETHPIVYSVVIPVYNNAATLDELLARLVTMSESLDAPMEAVFVVDGSPDDSLAALRRLLPQTSLRSQLVAHSRNFGSFAAIRTGFAASRGRYVAAMAADLQEPAELVESFFARLAAGDCDVAVGVRTGRADPLLSALLSGAFWSLYRRFVNRAIPPGGVDIFGCTHEVAARLTALHESHSSLIGLLYWIGYRRIEIPYVRGERPSGRSGWSFRRRLSYLLDSVYSFTNLPITMLVLVGGLGTTAALGTAIVVATFRVLGLITVPGYAAVMLVLLLSTTSILLALGIVGSYVWRTYENSKQRPHALPMLHEVHDP